MNRLTDEKWMRLALEEAERAAAEGEIPVGAVVVKGDEVLVTAHNLCEALQDATAHAERLAISSACQTLGRWRLSDCTLYVTLEPCPMCAGAAVNARVGRIVFAAKDPRAGACGSLLNLPAYPLECSPVCCGGVLEGEALDLLSRFFQARRKRREL